MRTRTTFALAVLLVLATACNQGAEPSAEPSNGEPGATALAVAPSEDAPSEAEPTAQAPSESTEDPDASEPSPRSGGRQTLEVWYVRSNHNRGPFVEPERFRPADSTTGVARAALGALLTRKPRDPGLINLVPEGTTLLDVTLEDRVLTVDLDLPDAGAGVGSEFEALLYEQIRHTGGQFSTVRRVEILEEGGDPTSGHLDPAAIRGPARPDKFAISPIIVTRPTHRQKVAAGEIRVRGSANVFEANVGLVLIDPNGDVAEETFTTATCGTGCRGTWAHTFTISEPGTWTLVASEDDASDGEGGGPFTTERAFVVR